MTRNLLLAALLAASATAQYSLGTLTGAAPGDRFGYAAAGLGDQDGDGVRDFVVGAPDEGGFGAAHVYSGATLALVRTLAGFGVDFGHAVASAGDVDGDGVDDVAVSDPLGPGPGASLGVVTVYSGATGLSLSSSIGSTAGSRFGWAIVSPGDFDGDGVNDLVVSAPLEDPQGVTDAGRVVAISVQTGLLLWSRDGTTPDGALGASLAAGGDFDGDGVPDVIAGAPGDAEIDPTAVLGTFTGSVYVFSGATGVTILTQSAFATGFGFAVAGPGDVTGDGFPDIAVGARFGGYWVLSGAATTFFPSLVSPGFIGFGRTIANVGDVDGNGLCDLAIGTTPPALGAGSTTGMHPLAGSVFLHNTTGLGTAQSVGEPLVPHVGFGPSQGRAIAGIGDVDGDGLLDLAVGAPDAGGAGRVRVLGMGAPPLAIQVVSGGDQVSTLGTPFPTPIVFEVLDATGLPVANQTVEFAATRGVVTSAVAVTDGLGRAATNALPSGMQTITINARTSGAAISGLDVVLPVRPLYVTADGANVTAVFFAGQPPPPPPGLPLILAVDAPLPSPGFIPTVHGDVYTSIASPGSGFAALDGIGLFGAPDPSVAASFGFFRVVPYNATALAGLTFVFQVYGLDLARPFPQNVFVTNPVTITL